MDNLIALSLVYNRVFMFGDRKDDPVKIPQGKDPYISARTLSQFYYDASADNAVLIMPASEPWLSRYTRTQKAAEQKIKVQRVINPGCAAALTDLYRHRREGLVAAVVQWDRTLEAVLLDTLDGVVSVCSVYTDTAADNIDLPRTLEKLLAESDKGEPVNHYLMPVDSMFPSARALTLNESQTRLVRNGNGFAFQGEPGQYRVYSPEGEFLALMKLEEGMLINIKSFFEV
jgi:hypothetical protein